MPISKHVWIISIGIVLVLVLTLILALKDSAITISASTLENALQKRLITKLWEKDAHLYAQFNDTKTYKILLSQVDSALLKTMPIEKDTINWLALSIIAMLVLGIVITIALFIARKASANPSIAHAQEPLAKESSISPLHSMIGFSDVAGIEDVKKELLEIVDFLRYPKKYQAFRVSLPRGVLLAGAPGVGKTLLAKALAGESGVPFFYQSGASFVEMYVGVGAKRVRELFAKAKASAPCIVFIDEIDAIGRAREGGLHQERESTLNQLLIEMDGFSDNSGVIVLAATNHIDVLDRALLRSGRFDRKLFIELPNNHEREQILRMYLSSKPHTLQDDIEQIAKESAGFSGAELATLINEAALHAISKRAPHISKSDIDAIYSKIQGGLKRLPLLDAHLRDVYALYHASKFLYALAYNIPMQQATLFHVSLLESSLEAHTHIRSTDALYAQLGFYLIGDRCLRSYIHQGYGIFGDDYNRAKNLTHQAHTLGLITKQERQKLLSSLIYKQEAHTPLAHTHDKHMASSLASSASNIINTQEDIASISHTSLTKKPHTSDAPYSKLASILEAFLTHHKKDILQLSAMLLQSERLELPHEKELIMQEEREAHNIASLESSASNIINTQEDIASNNTALHKSDYLAARRISAYMRDVKANANTIARLHALLHTS